jgi:hypothetical protein
MIHYGLQSLNYVHGYVQAKDKITILNNYSCHSEKKKLDGASEQCAENTWAHEKVARSWRKTHNEELHNS